MRILLTADPELPVPPNGYGGIERIVDALVREYRRRGHVVGLIARATSQSPADQRFAWPRGTSRGAANTLCNAMALRRAVRTFQPSVVHSFSRLAYLLPILRSSVPKVMSYQRHTGGNQVRWAANTAGASLRFTGCSEFICRMGQAAGGKWHAIPNFVETDKLDFVPAVSRDAPLVFLSRVEAIKGPDLAIAIARAAGRSLVIAGNRAHEGPEHAFWQRAIAPALGRDGIEYIGEVGDPAKNTLLGSAAGLLVPVQWDEPFGIVFAEALATGTPILSCPRGALPEIVEPGRTGFLFDSIDTGVASVSRLGTLSRAACRAAAECRYDVKPCADAYLALYALADRRAPVSPSTGVPPRPLT